MLVPLEFNPGIQRDKSNYASRGDWVDCNLIRFRGTLPESIGGWQKITDTPFDGYSRSLHQFSTLSGDILIAVGTSTRFYVVTGSAPDELTPLRRLAENLTSAIATSNGLGTITITDAGHGATAGDTIVISGAVDVGGILAAQINTEFEISEVVDADNYKVVTAGTASSTTSGGGSAVDVEYLINVGVSGQSAGTGWGSGTWSRDSWGSSTDLSNDVAGGQIGIWSIQSYNAEDLIVSPRGGALYYWDATSPTARPVNLTTLPGAASVPTVATKVIVSGFDGHVICFGCNEIGGSALNPMLIRWSDQESAAIWTVSDTTTSGQKLLSRGSKIVAAVQSGDDILIFTDTSVYAMTWVGGTVTFAFQLVAEGVDIASPNAAVLFGDNLYWMGKGGFYRFNGNVTRVDDSIDIENIPCAVEDYINLDVDWTNSDKIVAGINHQHNEIIWFYPSNDSTDTEPDKYVIYNVALNVWYYGTLSRTFWIDSTYSTEPIAASTDGYLYYHEIGADDGSTTPATALSPYIESGVFDIENGNKYQTITRVLHDVKFRGDDPVSQTINFSLEAADYDGQAIHSTTSSNASRTSITPIDQFTNQSFVRVRGRQFKIRVSSSTVGTSWRFGLPRIDVRADGRKS